MILGEGLKLASYFTDSIFIILQVQVSLCLKIKIWTVHFSKHCRLKLHGKARWLSEYHL